MTETCMFSLATVVLEDFLLHVKRFEVTGVCEDSRAKLS